MVEVANVQSDALDTGCDTVLEIGPGKGVLTKILLDTGANIIAVEKDAELIPILKEKFAEQIKSGELTLLNQDIIDFAKQIGPRGSLAKSYKIVANIPYNITGEILRTFLESAHQPMSMTLLVQKEVAQRIVANNNNKRGKESILSISVKAYGEPRYVQKVPAMLFNPAPKVDSAVLHIANISKDFFTSYNITEEQFFTTVKQGFAQKRKKLTNNLDIKPRVLTKLGLSADTRAERLTKESWAQLTQLIIEKTPS